MVANKAKKPVKTQLFLTVVVSSLKSSSHPKTKTKASPQKTRARNNPFNRQRLSAGGIFILKKR